MLKIFVHQGLKKTFFLLKFFTFVYVTACLLLFSQQNRLIFKPTWVWQKTPEDLNIPYQEVRIPVRLRLGAIESLHGWWLPAPHSQLGTLLYLHGAGFNIGTNINQAAQFQNMGFNVLLIDYRGYGKSQGNFPTELSVYQDAEIAWNYLVEEQQIPPEKIFIYGHSLGGAIAIDLAIHQPDAAGLIVQNTFTSMADMAMRSPYAKIFPVRFILSHNFDSVTKIKSLKVPVLFIHGIQDDKIPPSMAQTLYNVAPQPKKLLLIPDADHNNGDAFFNHPSYRKTLKTWAQNVQTFP